jgi:hypothetical protein
MAELCPRLNYGMGQCIRYITTHDDSGKSVFLEQPELLYSERNNYAVARAYAVRKVPAPLANNEDLSAYLSNNDENDITSYKLAGRSVTIDDGVNIVYMNMGPGSNSPMHRTVSVDFIAVVSGEIELELDSGQKRVLWCGVSISLGWRALYHIIEVPCC